MSEVDDAPLDEALTVAELNRRIADVVDGADGLESVLCVGEVSDVSVYDWGTFIDLVYDDHELTALMWASRWREVDVDIEPGMELLLDGTVDFYAERGTVSLKPWAIQVVGDGERATRLKQLRAELDARGWFDERHKQPLPRFPARIGVVTSADGDARFDIQEAVRSRYPSVDILLRDAYVQGDRAPASIASGIHALDRRGDVDVIVVGRGGGSETDLEAFDTEPVAEAVFTANTPVVAAVGHREDEPIVCDVADATAITPTEAGLTVVPDRTEVEASVAEARDRIGTAYERLAVDRLAELDGRVDDAHESLSVRRLAALDGRVEDGYETLEAARDRAATERRYRVVIAVLMALLLAAVLLALLLILYP